MDLNRFEFKAMMTFVALAVLGVFLRMAVDLGDLVSWSPVLTLLVVILSLIVGLWTSWKVWIGAVRMRDRLEAAEIELKTLRG